MVITDALTPAPTLATIITIRTGMTHSAEENPHRTVAAVLTMKGVGATTYSRLTEVAITVAVHGEPVAEADINTTISTMTRSGSAKATIITQIIQIIWVEAVLAIPTMVAQARIETLRSRIRRVDAHLHNSSEVVLPHTLRSLLRPPASTAEKTKTKRLSSRHQQSRKLSRRPKLLQQRIQVRL